MKKIKRRSNQHKWGESSDHDADLALGKEKEKGKGEGRVRLRCHFGKKKKSLSKAGWESGQLSVCL